MSSRLLIVNHSPRTASSLVTWFQQAGFRTILATSGQQALALAEETRPDLILLTVDLPGMNGIETAQRLRHNPATVELPVVLLTSSTGQPIGTDAHATGAIAVLPLDVSPEALIDQVRQLIHQENPLPRDDHRLLEELAHTTLALLSCQWVWLLTVDASQRRLISRVVVRANHPHTDYASLDMLDEAGLARDYLVDSDDNLRGRILSERQTLLDVHRKRLQGVPGAERLYAALERLGLDFITFLPLVNGDQPVGLMILGSSGHPLAHTGHTHPQHVVQIWKRHATIAVTHGHLLDDLVAREDRVRAEQAFRRMVLDAMGEGLIVIDAEARITYVNNRLLQLTGFKRDQLYGQSIASVFHPDDREALLHSLSGDRRRTLSFAQRLHTQDGQSIPVLLSRTEAPSPSGQGTSTIVVVTDVSELQRNEQALKRQTQRLQAINQASTAISSASSFQEVIHASLESALHVVNGVSAALYLYDTEQGGILVRVAALGPHYAHDGARQLVPGYGLIGQVARAAESQLITDTAEIDAVRMEYDALGGPPVQTILAVPLIAFDEVVGVLEVINRTHGSFDQQDQAMLESLSSSAAISIENSRLFDETQRRVKELRSLLDASAAVSSTLNFGEILERIARRLSVALYVERVVIIDWTPLARQLVTLAEVVNAYWASGIGPILSQDNRPLLHHAVHQRRPIFAGQSLADGGSAFPIDINPSGLITVAAYPLTLQGRIVGVAALCAESLRHADTQALQATGEVVQQWIADVTAYDAREWSVRPNLTDLCQRMLEASGLRWCEVWGCSEGNASLQLMRQVGHALWLDGVQHTWQTAQFPTFVRALETGNTLTLRRDETQANRPEQAYLQAIGGQTCLVAPLFIRGQASGLLFLVDSKPEPRLFDESERSLCMGIASVVGNAMDNAQLFTAQQQRASALEAAYRELQEADQMKDDLLQNLSHELRTPLTHILGYLRLMLDGAFGDLSAEQIETLQLITGKAEHLVELVQDIVDVQDTDARKLKLRPTHLHQVIAQVLRDVSAHAQAKHIRIITRVPNDLPTAYADPGRLANVFEELLENAIKFSPPGAPIELSAQDTGGQMLQISVRDRGIGIAPEQHEKIFRRFYQVDSGTTRRFGGNGLGLTIVRQIVEGHSGRIWVESAPGQGSCFYFTIPKASAVNQR